MPTIQITNGRVIDPSQNLDEITDIWIAQGRILAVGAEGYDEPEQVIDAKGLIVCPGLIDVHVHLREPGNEEDETIDSGASAALAGGIATVACMPNTLPPIDTRDAVEFVVLQAKRAKKANVYPVACVSKGRRGEELAELGQLVDGGAVAFTDDGAPIASASLMRQALRYAKMFNRVVMQHCQVPELTTAGVMHEGEWSTRLGLKGMPSAAEDIMVARDIRLAEITGGRLHIQHISTERSVQLVREARRRGLVDVTAEACPHHFTLTDDNLASFDTHFKMNPPLRERSDVEAVLEGLCDGTISILATDHAPHSPEKKSREIDQAPFGIVGLETLLPICIKALIEPGLLTWPQMIAKLTTEPAALLNFERKGTLRPGADADVTIIDPEARWTIDAAQFRSRSRNTPYQGWNVQGRAHTVIVNGQIRYSLDS